MKAADHVTFRGLRIHVGWLRWRRPAFWESVESWNAQDLIDAKAARERLR